MLGITDQTYASLLSNLSEDELRYVVPGFQASRDPNIFLVGLDASEKPCGAAAFDQFLAAAEHCYFFFNPMWSLQSPVFRANILRRLNYIAERFPKHKYTLLINDNVDYNIKSQINNDISVFICGEHSLASTKVFYFRDQPPEFSAVMVARNQRYKRIQLAVEVDNLCPICVDMDEEGLRALSNGRNNIYCPNIDGGRLVPHQLLELFSISSSGLILSNVEGQNRSTIEYLLAGLPVISTPNEGGRDRFLTPQNSVIVEPDSRAISRAVLYASRAGFDRKLIADGAREAVMRERAWLSSIVDETLAADGVAPVNLQALPMPHHGFSTLRSMADTIRIYFRKLPLDTDARKK